MPGRIVWLFILAGHALAAAGWAWMMPGGFPVTHARFWANRALPLLVVTGALLGLAAMIRKRASWSAPAIIGVPSLWLAGAVASIVVFPVSGWRVAPLAAFVGLTLVLLAWWLLRSAPAKRAALFIGVFCGAILGAVFPILQRSEEASTRPETTAAVFWDAQSPWSESSQTKLTTLVDLGPDVQLLTAEPAVLSQIESLSVELHPMLTFISRSPDRCWTILAPRAQRRGARRELIDQPDLASAVALRFLSDGQEMLLVTPGARSGEVQIDASSTLPEPVYSHLNSYCAMTVTGHRRLSLRFSPTGAASFAAEPSDYPIGRPARGAYLDAAGGFHVIEANSAEKGPYRELGAGPLRRNEALVITLLDEGQPVANVILEDWAAQAGDALSPTAGYGLPVNGIEFRRRGRSPAAPVGIWITLAGTSLGRGWDSVGHAAGSYRSRIRVERAE